ncbi:MAG: phosphatase [Ruminococcus sp.]|nr:phosphatase [Ruminococcus sp.]
MGLILEADLHTHTLASDHAYSTLRENCLCAAERGLKGLAITDHSPDTPDGAHLWHFRNLHVLPRVICGVTVLQGAEVNIIDRSGTIDMEEKTLRMLDWVVASMHNACMKDRDFDSCTNAYLTVAENPYVDVIGHCVTNDFRFDYELCIKKFAEYGKLVEINESSLMYKSGARENSIEVLRLCEKYGVRIVIDSDSHFCEFIGKTPLALRLIEETGFPQKLILNADWERVRKFVQKRHPGIDI